MEPTLVSSGVWGSLLHTLCVASLFLCAPSAALSAARRYRISLSLLLLKTSHRYMDSKDMLVHIDRLIASI